uniref:Uncharacterized protein n=1 Tax=Cucumis melo TaxID=3656 RepID=A0A9I9CD48_CUCME
MVAENEGGREKRRGAAASGDLKPRGDPKWMGSRGGRRWPRQTTTTRTETEEEEIWWRKRLAEKRLQRERWRRR